MEEQKNQETTIQDENEGTPDYEYSDDDILYFLMTEF